jgi:hypothetical protein
MLGKTMTKWVCTFRTNGLPFSIIIPLPTSEFEDAKKLILDIDPTLELNGRLLEEIEPTPQTKNRIKQHQRGEIDISMSSII